MSKKTTMQDIADSLGVSRITVWKALNDQTGVSEAVKAQVLELASRLGYARRPLQKTAALSSADEKNVSVIVSRPESSVFWTSIIHRIAKELSKSDINLLYTYVPSSVESEYQLPAALTNGTIQGAIILNVYDAHLLRLIDQLEIPKVYLDTVTSISTYDLNGDVLLLEGYENIRRITGLMLDRGRTQLGFIGDIDYARTNHDRYEGFLAALADRGISPRPEFCMTESFNVHDYYQQIARFLDHLKKYPQGFVCASDDVAYFVLQHSKEKGIRVPQDLALSGFDGCSNYNGSSDFLTTVDVQTSLLGKRLARQLLYRIENPSADFELIYLNSRIKEGPSTEI